MDLRIAGKWALVCGASKGLGRGCAQALASEGVNLVINARNPDALESTARELRMLAPNVDIRTAVGDIATEQGRDAALAQAPAIDILINNAGGPPAGDMQDWTRDDWIRALDANMLAPIALIKATVDGMAERGYGRVINITSSAVKAPIAALGLSNGARSGLTGFIAGLARQPKLAGRNVTLNNVLPGTFDTDRLRSNLTAMAGRANAPVESYTDHRRNAIPAQRFGTPAEFGAVCAFLCGMDAGYLTGQNILLDGGAYPGTF
ncbi:SDR family NAD(P)-dependent oxidoreductase [Achromobacter spanius]|uniref:3-oxoacyl-ACP reductase n=1 Tax=Achromobacter spanius TaxID=217203 RepID=A0AAW3I2E0_9BURK|nr:SDR family NAD(P)-dependent oxidoreductase [Achromobacter spanius]KNE26212.1 3-oxoacyl-ACP reductase [Achromobacter spanius]MCW3156269.1 SDR family oxidoreductase [Achromobacter spanius]